ncbi:MAG: NAD-dependent epimerase/dehydratase family protein, partial [Flavobacteriales bacterium]|nr:NAD-dependent epimerase/dehydratase family protein [Flavobacteriales bacterium]
QDLSYPIPAIAARAARKEDPFEVWGTGKQGRDFVHIDDVLDLTLLAMDKISDGTAINIGMGKLTSFLEIIELFTSFAGYTPTIKPLLDKPVGVHSRYCDMSWVEEHLGWKARISTEEGMRRVYDAAVARVKAGE